MVDPDPGLLAALRELIELDRGFGLEVVEKGGAVTALADGVADSPEASPPAIGQSEAQSLTQPPMAPSPATLPVAPPPATPAQVPAVVRVETVPVSALATTNDPGTGSDVAATLADLATRIAGCKACALGSCRTRTVPGEGNPRPELVFVGEGPGADEDASGRPFVGKAGQLLDAMIIAMGLRRDQVFIANVVKCRPPENRTPEPEEIAACMPFLQAQLAALAPKVICTLGATPLKALLGNPKAGITALHGSRQVWRGVPLIPTYHPAYLLRNPAMKKPCWEDLKIVLGVLGRTPPPRAS
jgi:uracil-DNA glycosylase family 4